MADITYKDEVYAIIGAAMDVTTNWVRASARQFTRKHWKLKSRIAKFQTTHNQTFSVTTHQ